MKDQMKKCLSLSAFALAIAAGVPAAEAVNAKDEFESLTQQAKLAGQQNDFAAAEALYRKASLLADSFDPRDYRVCEALVNLSSALVSQRKYADAELIDKRVIEIKSKQSGAESLDASEAYFRLAQVYEVESGKYDEGLALLNRDLHIKQAQLGMGAPDTLQKLRYLATSLWIHHRYKEACVAFEQSNAAWQKYGSKYDSDMLAYDYENLAACYGALGKYKQAADLCVAATAFCRKDNASLLQELTAKGNSYRAKL